MPTRWTKRAALPTIAFPVITLVSLLAAPTWAAQPAPTVQSAPPPGIARLAALGRLWGAVKFAHPWLAYKPIDWDGALVAAIPKVEAARTTDEYVQAVQKMLEALGDGATHVMPTTLPPAPAGTAAPTAPFEWLPGQVLLLHPFDAGTVANPDAAVASLRAELAKATTVLFDLRGRSVQEAAVAANVIDKLADALPWRSVNLLGTRHLVHQGYHPQSNSSLLYHSSMMIDLGRTFVAAKDAKPRRYAFILGLHSTLPEVGQALVRGGDALLVTQGPLNPDSYVTQQGVPLGEGWEVWLRTTESADATLLRPDAEVPLAAAPAVAIARATALLRKAPIKRATPAMPPPLLWSPDAKYDQSRYPSRELRLLALFRIWNVIDRFYAYKPLLDDDWQEMLVRYLPRFADAANAREYALAVAELSTHVPDGHTGVGGPELREYFGAAPTAVRLRMIEGAPVVTDFYDKEAAQKAGVQVGDVVVKVDGEPADARIQRLARYTTGSTRAGHMERIMQRLLNGPDGSTAALTLRGPGDRLKEVQLPRALKYFAQPPRRAGEMVRILPGNVGYVDLERLQPGDVDGMFDKLKGTRAIIFDLRDYPNGTMWTIAPRINTRNARFGATFEQPTLDAAWLQEQRVRSQQSIAPTTLPKYTGKIVVLIDERAQSHAEHTGLFFEAASGCTFVGSHTSGANGNITDLSIPGGMTMVFTGLDTRHADGRQLQRVGLVPHIEIKPTIAGVRAGRDEVLERALRFLADGK